MTAATAVRGQKTGPNGGVVAGPCRRINVAFSAGGRWASCVRVCDEQITLERWVFPDDRAPRRESVDGVAADVGTQSLPLDDGRLIVFPNSDEQHQVVMVGAGTDSVTPLGMVAALGGYLLASPSPDLLGLLITFDDADASTIWRVTDSPVTMTRAVRLGGTLSGGAWLDPQGNLVVLNRRHGSGTSEAIAVDLDEGAHAPVFSVSDKTNDLVLLADPRSRLVVVSTDATGERRLGWTTIGAGESIHFPERLNAPGHDRQVLSLDPAGSRVLLHEQRGTTSRLSVYGLADDSECDLDIPVGAALLCPSWTDDAIRLPFSTPRSPTTMLTIPTDGRPAQLHTDPDYTGPATADAELVQFDGAVGPVEAIVYGGPGWRSRDRVVIALHGGPVSSWRMEYDPLFQALARAGCAVVAPNCRGSVGYGDDHLEPIRGDWGGPDLDDVLHIAAQLERERDPHARKPVVLGASYGGYLALLAAGSAPDRWSACVAVAPFLSTERLYAEASPWVGNNVAGAGALATVAADRTTRDVLAVCESISVPLLVAHGVDDELIPVGQSRALRDRLRAAGRTDGVDYREVAANHDSTCRLERSALRAAVVSFVLS
ncbi:MAG TPA: alpha/beta fold hydrolase [Mycobacteriales bacterium]